jgi:hypothetical protein
MIWFLNKLSIMLIQYIKVSFHYIHIIGMYPSIAKFNMNSLFSCLKLIGFFNAALRDWFSRRHAFFILKTFIAVLLGV